MTKPDTITVYRDAQDAANEGWAVRWTIADVEQSDSVDCDSSASLDDAIDQACHQLDTHLTHDDFAREQVEGGVGHWAAADE